MNNVFFLCLLTSFVLLTCSCGPAPTPVQPPAKPLAALPFFAVNGTSALARVAALCALGPRDAGTPGGERAAQWLAAELRRDGLDPQIDTFTDDTPSGPLTCHNVLVSIQPVEAGASVIQRTPGRARPPDAPSAAASELAARLRESGGSGGPALPKRDGRFSSNDCIVLLSHFDTKTGISTNFIGANDGGSSTGLLLEFAHVLHNSPLRHCPVLFGFLDGEECRVQYGPHDGFHGSRRLAAQLAAEHRNVRAVILLDMIGDRDLTVTLPANGSPELTLLALEAAKIVGVREKFSLADGRVLDDHQAFLDAGFPAVDLIDFIYGSAPGLNDYWHTPADTMDKISAESLTSVGQVVAEMLRQIDAK